MKNSIILSLFCICISCNQEQKTSDQEITIPPNQKEALLIGTFHYNNPGADVAKTKSFDILSESAQNELEQITAHIKTYQPTKVFVEWPYDEQPELDSLYQLYRKGLYFEETNLSDFYRKNEIFQLAFRVAAANELESVHAIDYATSFPFQDVMNDIETNNQEPLKAEIQAGIEKFTTDFDNKIASGLSLTELTYYMNGQELRSFSNHWHNNLMLRAGGVKDVNGPLLTSEWFKRNLFMWSFVQKQTSIKDEKIMILVGASHAAMFEKFIQDNPDWRSIELIELMK